MLVEVKGFSETTRIYTHPGVDSAVVSSRITGEEEIITTLPQQHHDRATLSSQLERSSKLFKRHVEEEEEEISPEALFMPVVADFELTYGPSNEMPVARRCTTATECCILRLLKDNPSLEHSKGYLVAAVRLEVLNVYETKMSCLFVPEPNVDFRKHQVVGPIYMTCKSPSSTADHSRLSGYPLERVEISWYLEKPMELYCDTSTESYRREQELMMQQVMQEREPRQELPLQHDMIPDLTSETGLTSAKDETQENNLSKNQEFNAEQELSSLSERTPQESATMTGVANTAETSCIQAAPDSFDAAILIYGKTPSDLFQELYRTLSFSQDNPAELVRHLFDGLKLFIYNRGLERTWCFHAASLISWRVIHGSLSWPWVIFHISSTTTIYCLYRVFINFEDCIWKPNRKESLGLSNAEPIKA